MFVIPQRNNAALYCKAQTAAHRRTSTKARGRQENDTRDRYRRAVHEIGLAQVVAFYLFDVAESIDLAAVSSLMGTQAVAARLAPKSATPAYVQYEKPPLSLDGEVFETLAKAERSHANRFQKALDTL